MQADGSSKQGSRDTIPASESSVVIRDLTPDDFADLRGLYAASLSRHKKGFIQPTPGRPLRDIGDICNSFQDNDGAMHGLYVNGVLAGCGGLCRHHSAGDERRVELCKLHLKEEYQGRGLGRRLVESLIAKATAKGYATVELHVTSTQAAALGLYMRMGFVQTARKIYVSDDGETFDTIYMERPACLQID